MTFYAAPQEMHLESVTLPELVLSGGLPAVFCGRPSCVCVPHLQGALHPNMSSQPFLGHDTCKPRSALSWRRHRKLGKWRPRCHLLNLASMIRAPDAAKRLRARRNTRH